jgi:hypothetical protein
MLSAVALLMSSAAMAQTKEVKIGDVTMTITPEKGAKITSLKYQDQEVISQLRWPESFGSTFWTSPQKEWNWPPVFELDKGVYEVVEKDGHLVMTSPVSEKLKYRVRKDFSTDKKDGAIVITYSIINESGEERKVAPWEITRVPNAGVIKFDAPVESIWPAGLMNFEQKDGVACYAADEAQQNRKVNADGKGWLSYENNGLVLTKKFADLKADEPAPGEAEIQVYVNRGKTYIELESQGAYATLKPHGQLSWTVRWYLLPIEGASQPSEKLIKAVRDRQKFPPIR